MASSLNGDGERRPPTKSKWMILLLLVILMQWSYIILFSSNSDTRTDELTSQIANLSLQYKRLQNEKQITTTGTVLDSLLTIRTDKAVAMPSVRISEQEDKSIDRTIYGGEGDKLHLGGFTDMDIHGVSPATWKHMITYFGIKSLLDVGCGRGISTSWFGLHGVDTMCVEGSHDAVTKSMFDGRIVEHDFSRGPWWPPQTVDAVWCVEFLEHVGRNFHQHYIPAFRKAALVFASHSQWGGWHHVEVHDDTWWTAKMESYGFVYSDALTSQVREVAKKEAQTQTVSPNGKNYNAQHVWLTMQVFINPSVASLPQHQHLFAQHGCFLARDKPNKECGTGRGGEKETPLPKEYLPLQLTDEMDTSWIELLKKNIKLPEEEENKSPTDGENKSPAQDEDKGQQ